MVEVADGAHTAADLAKRKGYNAKFLNATLPVAIPDLGAVKGNLVPPSDATKSKPFEIRYTHSGVYYSRSPRTPLFAAVNIDSASSQRIKREPPDK